LQPSCSNTLRIGRVVKFLSTEYLDRIFMRKYDMHSKETELFFSF
jgi:hypothetical protein